MTMSLPSSRDDNKSFGRQGNTLTIDCVAVSDVVEILTFEEWLPDRYFANK